MPQIESIPMSSHNENRLLTIVFTATVGRWAKEAHFRVHVYRERIGYSVSIFDKMGSGNFGIISNKCTSLNEAIGRASRLACFLERRYLC